MPLVGTMGRSSLAARPRRLRTTSPVYFFFLMRRPPPASTLFPYTTLFRSADWDGLTATIAATGAGEIWVTHGQEDALVHWCKARRLAARPLDLVGYGDEDEHEAPSTNEAEA